MILTSASLHVFSPAAIGLEGALSINARTIDVHLPLVATDSILIQTLILVGTPAAVLAAPTRCFEYLRAVAHDFGGFARDARLKVELLRFFMSLERALKVENLISPAPVVQQQVLSRNLTPLVTIGIAVLRNIGLRLEGEAIDFGA